MILHVNVLKKLISTHTDPTTKLEAGVEILIFIIKYRRIIGALFHEGWGAEPAHCCEAAPIMLQR